MNTFLKSESTTFKKSVLPECPICGSGEIKLIKTLFVGKKPNQ